MWFENQIRSANQISTCFHQRGRRLTGRKSINICDKRMWPHVAQITSECRLSDRLSIHFGCIHICTHSCRCQVWSITFRRKALNQSKSGGNKLALSLSNKKWLIQYEENGKRQSHTSSRTLWFPTLVSTLHLMCLLSDCCFHSIS